MWAVPRFDTEYVSAGVTVDIFKVHGITVSPVISVHVSNFVDRRGDDENVFTIEEIQNEFSKVIYSFLKIYNIYK